VKQNLLEPAPLRPAPSNGVHIQAAGLIQTAGKRKLLNDVSFEVKPGELVAIVGGSGAGKTTLLDALAGVRPAHSGEVRFDDVSVYQNLQVFRSVLGYVPQDDIIHADLPLRRTLRYAAQLRLPGATSSQAIDVAVARAMEQLGLTERAEVTVGALSGGQRKRASIAVELLTNPRVFFLDEPTSGLDPSTAADLVQLLQRLALSGSTVVFTTHSIQDLGYCGRVVFLARGGFLAFFGAPAEALRYFEVERIEQIYQRLERELSPEEWGRKFQDARPAAADSGRVPKAGIRSRPTPPSQPGPLRQWGTLTARTFESLVRNRLTMAILLGSPLMIVAMFAILFERGAFNAEDPSPTAILMILFWITFGAFFFGVTYGLLQIVTERAILRRENLVGVRLSSYLLAKTAVLMPFLLVVAVLMLAILRALERLPDASLETYVSVGVTLSLTSAAALTLGLLTSAVVRNASQATLALPLLCFPVVLFSGAILPVNVMATVGRAISTVMPVRWAFEAVGRDFGARALLEHGRSPLGPPLVASYGDAGNLATGTYWLYLAAFVVVFLVGAWGVLAATIQHASR